MSQAFPNKDKIRVKDKFKERYIGILDESGYEEFMDASLRFMKRAIRVNTLKISVPELVARIPEKWKLTPVAWNSEAFWVEHSEGRRDIGNLTEHTLGYFYVQDPSSGIPPLVLNPKPGDIVLDMCAAPGSKTSQMAQLMKNEGLIVANEFDGKRIAALGINLQRTGAFCTVITHGDGNRLDKKIQFDKVLVDAPCSGTGTIRKSPKTLMMWNPNMITRLSRTQLGLLRNAYKHLKPGGEIVYSTCTLEPEENEGVISSFLKDHPDMDVCDIELQIKRSNPILEFNGTVFDERVKKCLRIWPQDNDSEGFFVCKLKMK